MVRISPGLPYNDPPGGLQLCRAAAQLQADGSWKVTDFGLHEGGNMRLNLRLALATAVAAAATALLAAQEYANPGGYITCGQDPPQPYCLVKPSTPGNDDSSGKNSGGRDSDGCVLERVEI